MENIQGVTAMNGNAAIAAGPEEGQIPLRSPQDTPLSETPSTEKDAEELPAKIAAATVNTPASNKDKPKATPKSSGKRVKKEAEEGGQDVTPSKKPKNEVPESHATPTTKARQRKAPANKITGSKIPTSMEEMTLQDQTLIRMKDSGSPWKDIRKKWEDLTGEKTGTSTLPNRYARLKANITKISADDQARMLKFKAELEAQFDIQKWERIREEIVKDGGADYTTMTLQKVFKQVSANGIAASETATTAALAAGDGDEDMNDAEEGADEV